MKKCKARIRQFLLFKIFLVGENMAAPRSQLISLLIRKKLYQEVDQILSILRQGFDVHVKSQFSEVERLLINFLEQEILANPTEFRLVLDPSLIGSEQESIEIEEQGIKPTVLVSSENLEKGFGFVQLNVRAPDYLIGSVASAIETILEHFSLTVYLDIFDSNILTRLKQIARMFGLCVLIDAVIQTAYLGGFHGDANMVLRYLEGLQSEGIDLNKKTKYRSKNVQKCFLPM